MRNNEQKGNCLSPEFLQSLDQSLRHLQYCDGDQGAANEVDEKIYAIVDHAKALQSQIENLVKENKELREALHEITKVGVECGRIHLAFDEMKDIAEQALKK